MTVWDAFAVLPAASVKLMSILAERDLPPVFSVRLNVRPSEVRPGDFIQSQLSGIVMSTAYG